MSSEFESGFFVHEPAWHGLGTVLDKAPTIEEAIVLAGLDWKVKEHPIYADVTAEFGEKETRVPSNLSERVYSHKAIVRETDNSVLGIVGSTYTPIQNSDAFQFFDKVLESGSATLEAGGSLRHGQKIWVLANMIKEGEVLKGDEVQSHLLLSNSHDGMMSLWIQFTPIRVVCMNTLTAALSTRHNDYKAGKAIRLRHAPRIEESLQIAKTLINTATETFTTSMEAYKLFTRNKMTDTSFLAYVDSIFKLPPKEVDVDELRKDMDERKVSKRDEILTELFQTGAGTDINGVRGTVWAGYNAITEWVEHYRGYSAQEGRLENSWFGEGTVIRNKAFAEAVKVSA